MIIVTAVAGFILAIPCGFVAYKVFHRNRRTVTVTRGDQEETSTMLSDVKEEVGTQHFLQLLKTKYKRLYDAVQPIPYIREKMTVNKVFIDPEVELQVKGSYPDSEWKRFESFSNYFRDQSSVADLYVIQGEPGYGKSTLALQLAYDWCTNTQDSPVNKFELLLFIRMGQLSDKVSLEREIRRLLLPKDITEKKIKSLIREFSSVLIILDGFDEYLHSDINNDIMTIIQNGISRNHSFIVTTRPTGLSKLPHTSKLLKLTGFNENARHSYILKAVISGNDSDTEINEIERRLATNPVLGNLCISPLFFVMYAHMTHTQIKAKTAEHEPFNSATSFFRYMIKCFHSHARNKGFHTVDDDDYTANNKLWEVAYAGLLKKQLSFNKAVFKHSIGKDCYHTYAFLGILVEEETIIGTDGAFLPDTQVKFYHSIFCEWYASKYLSRYLEQRNYHSSKNLIGKLKENEHFHTICFTCGQNSDAADKIVHYFKERYSQKFVSLCMLESTNDFDEMKETVQDICSQEVEIEQGDNILLQRSAIQILRIASSNEIPVLCVKFNNALLDVSEREPHLVTNLNLHLPTLRLVSEISVTDTIRLFDQERTQKMFYYASMCHRLQVLRFVSSMLPFLLSTDTLSHLPTTLQVIWKPLTSVQYNLNCKSGKWENTTTVSIVESYGDELTSSDYKQYQQMFNQRKQSTEE